MNSEPNGKKAGTRSNNGIAKLGVAGDLAFFSGQASGSVHVIFDVGSYLE